jgi:hypothetical protein
MRPGPGRDRIGNCLFREGFFLVGSFLIMTSGKAGEARLNPFIRPRQGGLAARSGRKARDTPCSQPQPAWKTFFGKRQGKPKQPVFLADSARSFSYRPIQRLMRYRHL